MATSNIPTTAGRTSLNLELQKFLADHPTLHLGGAEDFHAERRHHLEVFGIHALSEDQINGIKEVEFTAIRGPYGSIPIRVLYPDAAPKGGSGHAALIYFHGGGYTVGSVDEFENACSPGLRLLAQESQCQIYAIEYRLAPEFRYPTQLDEYAAVIDALQSDFGASRGVDAKRVFGGGDSAGGNMTAAIALRRRDEGRQNLAGQFLFYPEARVPFDTPAGTENNTGLYLECNGIFSFADHYLPRGVTPAFKYVSPGMQPIDDLKGVPPARIFTSGFDPLRDVGVEYAHKLEQAGVSVKWRHYEDLTHGWVQMTPWSIAATNAVKDSAKDLKELATK